MSYKAPQYVDGWPADAREFGAKVHASLRAFDLPAAQVAKAAGLSRRALLNVRRGAHRATQDTRWRIIRVLTQLTPPVPALAVVTSPTEVKS